jgi:hypothetical protein
MKISETIRYRIKEAGADFRCSNNSAGLTLYKVIGP